jgi:hypothetical protein
VRLTAVFGTLAGVRLGTGAIYLIAAVPLVIAALIAWVIWRSAKRERASRALRSRLESPNPQTRRDALDKVTDEMLSIHSVMLCELLARESDPDVLDALAAAIAGSKWEPTDDAALMQLRRWVAGGQIRTTSSSPSSPAMAPATPEAPSAATASQPAPPAPAPASDPPRAAVIAPREVTTPAAWPSTSTNGREGTSSVPPLETPGHDDAVTDLVHKVRAVLGDDVERVEMVSIDGELLTSWSSGQRAEGEEPPASDDV